MSTLKDSGKTREFSTGAHRDAADDKGRMDLVPLKEASFVLLQEVEKPVEKHEAIANILNMLCSYQENGNIEEIAKAAATFAVLAFNNIESGLIEVSKQYQAGALKYGENNWKLGMPFHVYIDSGIRHVMKWSRGDVDEPHDRAFLWNLLSLMWEHNNKPELNDFNWK